MLDFGFYNMDCMEGMKEFPDKYFDLSIIDPPYGINRFMNGQPTRLNKYGNMSQANDLKPTKEFFTELFRVSKNQIVWGYNHLSDLLPPTKLYEWILSKYAKPGDTILDTHVGSGSSLIACHNTNHKYVGFEIDETYYKKAKERIERETAQMNIFDWGYNPYQE